MKYIHKCFFENLIKKSAHDKADDLKKSKKAGFTLVELLIVVAVLALLVGFSVGAMSSVNRRKATRAGKIIESELTLLTSNAYSREGAWRLELSFDDKDECYVLTQQYNISDPNDEEYWVDFSEKKLSPMVSLSFGGDEYDEEKSKGTHYISVSREKGKYLTQKDGNYFCDKIFVHSASKVVTVHLSSESGGHRVVD